MKSGYKESKADKAARERERRIASETAAVAASDEAAGLTSDLRAIYGLRGMTGARGSLTTPTKAKATAAPWTRALGIPGNSPAMLGVPRNLWDMVMTGAPK
jgi:hypothetical protein